MKTGFIGIIGRPNVGKSQQINRRLREIQSGESILIMQMIRLKKIFSLYSLTLRGYTDREQNWVSI